MSQQTVVFVDLETGGTTIGQHPIIQIAAIAVSGGGIVEEFERKLRFDLAACDPEALKLNSYDEPEWSAQAVDQRVAMYDFSAFLKRNATVELVSKRTGNPYRVAQLSGHNITGFDAPMLRHWYSQAGEFFPGHYHALDTLQLAMWHFYGKRERPFDMKLGTLAKWFGIETDDAHDAMADVKMAYRIAVAIRKSEAKRLG